LQLPSRGTHYKANALEYREDNQYPVFGMTARDELLYKTPDGLMNGQATVDVIQSCVPNIRDGWEIPNIDLEAIMIAIRIATTGDKLEISQLIPGLKEEREFEIDLTSVLDQIYAQEFVNTVTVGDFTLTIKPVSYRYSTDVSLKTFEEQRIFQVLKNDEMSEADKLKIIQKSFTKLTNMNIEMIQHSVVSVQYKDEEVITNTKHINEFLENTEKEIYHKIISRIEEERDKFILKPFTIEFSKEDQEAGSPVSLSVPVMLDQSNFFV
jgi:hypothetical protein